MRIILMISMMVVVSVFAASPVDYGKGVIYDIPAAGQGIAPYQCAGGDCNKDYQETKGKGGRNQFVGDQLTQALIEPKQLNISQTIVKPFPTNAWLSQFFWFQFRYLDSGFAPAGNRNCAGAGFNSCLLLVPDLGVNLNSIQYMFPLPLGIGFEYWNDKNEPGKIADVGRVGLYIYGPQKSHYFAENAPLKSGKEVASIMQAQWKDFRILPGGTPSQKQCANVTDVPVNAMLNKLGAWSAEFTMKYGNKKVIDFILVQGSPYMYFTSQAGANPAFDFTPNEGGLTGGNLEFYHNGPDLAQYSGSIDDGMVAFSVKQVKKHDTPGHTNYYAIYVPPKSSWFKSVLNGGGDDCSGEGSYNSFGIKLDGDDQQKYFVVALLPLQAGASKQDVIAAMNEFANYAFNYVSNTWVKWHVSPNGKVDTEFIAQLIPHNVFANKNINQTILGILPHQYLQLVGNPLPLQNDQGKAIKLFTAQYQTAMGNMKTIIGNRFHVVYQYSGILPYLPPLPASDKAGINKTKRYLDQFIQQGNTLSPAFTNYLATPPFNTYAAGKILNKVAQVMLVAKNYKDYRKPASAMQNAVGNLLQRYFNGKPVKGFTSGNHADFASYYFAWNRDYDRLVSYRSGFGNASTFNDHVLQYGYWIYSAAVYALFDPEWAQQSQWGSVINQMISDVSPFNPADPSNLNSGEFRSDCGEQGTEFCHRSKSWDPYMGHAWASGMDNANSGPNLESSSEQLNAYAGMILWGQASNQPTVTNLGIYLYTTAVHSIWSYWFGKAPGLYDEDYLRVNFEDTNYQGLTGGLSASGPKMQLFFEPNYLAQLGINVLPMTAASLYLAMYPDYASKTFTKITTLFSHNTEASDSNVHPFTANPWGSVMAKYVSVTSQYQKMFEDSNGKLLANGAFNTKLWNPDNNCPHNRCILDGNSRVHTYYWMRSLYHQGLPNFNYTANTPLFAAFSKQGKDTCWAYNASSQPKKVIFYYQGKASAELTIAPRTLASTDCRRSKQ